MNIKPTISTSERNLLKDMGVEEMFAPMVGQVVNGMRADGLSKADAAAKMADANQTLEGPTGSGGPREVFGALVMREAIEILFPELAGPQPAPAKPQGFKLSPKDTQMLIDAKVYMERFAEIVDEQKEGLEPPALLDTQGLKQRIAYMKKVIEQTPLPMDKVEAIAVRVLLEAALATKEE